jgi:hypothetical protein
LKTASEAQAKAVIAQDGAQRAHDAAPTARNIAALDAAKTARREADSAFVDARKTATAPDDAMALAQGGLRDAATKFVKADSDWREADQKAKAAEAKYDQTLRALIENRSSIVVKDPTAEGKNEYIISGAPAKVMVQGLGAAFTTFLAGQAGVQILSTGERANAFSLLLACFIGAVFAEEIWKQARKWLPNGGETPPKPPPCPCAQENPAAPAAAQQQGAGNVQ